MHCAWTKNCMSTCIDLGPCVVGGKHVMDKDERKD